MENDIFKRALTFVERTLSVFGLVCLFLFLPVIVADKGVRFSRFQLVLILVISLMYAGLRELITIQSGANRAESDDHLDLN
jgi:hypothetical protein